MIAIDTRLRLSVLTLLGAGLAQAATLPAETCTSTGAGARTCELTAGVGSLTLPGGGTVPAWGYSLGAGALSVPGPVLIVNQGETVTVNLTNDLPAPTSLLFHGQAMAPDQTGAPSGGSASYQFVASAAGTFLFEAGLTPNSAHQVAMGLFGVLIVRPPPPGVTAPAPSPTTRPTPDLAYAQPSSAFDDEVLVVLSELDPALNGRADPSTFDMRDFAPKYFLINGKAYPQTEPIGTAAGRRVLLRYVNAGLQSHSMSLLGLEQAVLGLDGSPKPFVSRVVAETIGAGQAVDVVTTVPAAAVTGSRFALYEASFTLHNDGAPGFGGMLTFLTTGVASPGSAGPQTSGVTASPNPTDGSVTVTLTALITNPGGVVAGAEYFMDLMAGAGLPVTAVDGAFDSASEQVRAFITSSALAGLPSGNHVLGVRGRTPAGVWGPINFGVLNLDKTGPLTTAVLAVPNPTNGTMDVELRATGDDRSSGGSIVDAAEFFIDVSGAPGTGTPMTTNLSATEVSLSGMLDMATLAGLAAGDHLVAVRSRDALGNWGDVATSTLVVDRTGPATNAFLATPNPSDGRTPVNGGVPVVRLTATLVDAASTIAAGEAFIGTLGATGTGLVFVPADGLFDARTEAAFADVPLATVSLLPSGPHTLYARARDSAGNWGAMSTLVFIVDRTAPGLGALSFAPNPTNSTATSNTNFTVSATASDTGLGGSNIVRAEWFSGVDPGVGFGTPMGPADGAFNSATEQVTGSINFQSLGWPAGNRTISVRARDAANNWTTTMTGVVNIVLPNLMLSDNFEGRTFAAWSSVTGGAGLAITNAAALQGTWGLAVTLNGANPRYLTSTGPVAERSYHARFSFNPNTATPNTNQAIFVGRSAGGQDLFRVEFRRLGRAAQVRGVVATTGGNVATPFITLSAGTGHSLELSWTSGAPATFDFLVDGALQRLSGLNTSPFALESVRLGPSSGLAGGASGIESFDAFVSTRRTAIGP